MTHKHHTHARTHTNAHARTHTVEDGPTSPAARLSLDVRCCRQLHSSHLLWIYYLLCSSKHRFIFPRKSKRTDAHSVVLLKIRTFRDAAMHEADICIRRKSKSPSWVPMMCAQMFLHWKKNPRCLMKYQSVLCASMKLEHQRPPFSHQNPWVQCFSLPHPCSLAVFADLLKRPKLLMIQDPRRRDSCQQHWGNPPPK